MKPLSKAKDLLEIRPPRKSLTELMHKGESHGWAVSYADLLMVLLSFFVIFFSLEDGSEDAIRGQLQRISMTMRGENPGKYVPPKAMRLVSLAEILKDKGLKVTPYPDKILIDLQNSAYRPGQYKITPEFQGQIDEVFEKLRPYQQDLHFTIIGHADTQPMRARSELLSDNFDLSSIRALRVLKHVVALGFPENEIVARAAGSFDRNARAISVELRLREEKEPTNDNGDGA